LGFKPRATTRIVGQAFPPAAFVWIGNRERLPYNAIVPSNPPGYAVAYVEERTHLFMIRKLKSGSYRLYSRKKNPTTGKRRNLGTFKTRAAAKKHEKAVQYFKRR
jgi:hypothetical protein